MASDLTSGEGAELAKPEAPLVQRPAALGPVAAAPQDCLVLDRRVLEVSGALAVTPQGKALLFQPVRAVPTISQETLSEMVGTTRSRVNFFLNKFRKMGFIEYEGERPIKINSSLLSVVLHD